eukprot:1180767-Prorocentrum_minimum.AAC.1
MRAVGRQRGRGSNHRNHRKWGKRCPPVGAGAGAVDPAGGGDPTAELGPAGAAAEDFFWRGSHEGPAGESAGGGAPRGDS